MTVSKPFLLVAIAALAVLFFTSASHSYADTYTFFDLGSADDGRDPLGITSTGTVVISAQGGPCGSPINTCFETYTNGVLVAFSTTNPGLVYDNGSPCTPTVSPAIGSTNVAEASCNGAREVFGTGHFAPSPFENSIFDGPNPSNFVASHSVDTPFRLNASGDFVVVADQITFPSDGEIFEAIDTTVPEPGSILLLDTGVLAAAGAMRRRFLQ
jgi:hypothetical protein